MGDVIASCVNYYKAAENNSINPFYANFPFLYPLKISENQRFSDVFRVYRNVLV